MNSSYEDKPDSIENKERFKGPKKKFNLKNNV